MISAPSTEFGLVGSWVLYDRNGARHACRILSLSLGFAVSTATISLADDPWVSTGQVVVPVDALEDPTPLSATERAELEHLLAHLNGLANPKRSAKATRADALQRRNANAIWLIGELKRINRTRLATRATREAQRYFEGLQAETGQTVGAAA